MKLMINIPDEAYELLKSKSELDNIAESIIANGTPISSEGDLINRSALKKAACVKFYTTPYYKHILDLIDNAPTVDIWQIRQEATENALKKAEVLYERPHGKWIEVKPHQSDLEDGIDYREECSICHEPNRHYGFDEYHDIRFATYYKTNFCPNCGAEMEGGAT